MAALLAGFWHSFPSVCRRTGNFLVGTRTNNIRLLYAREYAICLLNIISLAGTCNLCLQS